MERQITAEELRQIVRAARVLATDLDEEKLQALPFAQQRLADSGFLEAVWGVVRLHEERGITCSEALDAYQRLLQQAKRLEAQVAGLRQMVAEEQARHSEAVKRHQELTDRVSAAREELEAIQSAIESEEERLSSFQRKAEGHKRRIERDLERCRNDAGATRAEVVAAGELKAEVQKSSFTLETMLGLAREFAPYQDARDRLAEALKTGQSLTEHISTLEEEAERNKRHIAAAVDRLESRRNSEQAQVDRLQKARDQLEAEVSRLHADLDQEQELRQFYLRYSPMSGLMDYLASWRQVLFLRCQNPMCAPFAGITRFWTDKPASRCPHCGLGPVSPDPEALGLLNHFPGIPLESESGE